MSDEEVQELRRRVLGGDAMALERLKTWWLRTHRIVEDPATDRKPRELRVQPVGVIRGQVIKEPIFDREILPAGGPGTQGRRNRVAFYQNPSSFLLDSARSKIFGVDTNLYGNGGVPAGMELGVYGASLIPDAGCSLRDYYQLYNEGSCSFLHGQTRSPVWPCRLLMLPPQVLPTSPEGVLEIIHPMGPAMSMTVGNEPVVLRQMEDFRVDLDFEPPMDRMGVMFVLFAVRTRAVGA